MIIRVCILMEVYSWQLYFRTECSGLCDWNVWLSWRVVRRAPEWAELSPDVCPSVGYESCPPPEAPEILCWEEEQVMLFDIQQPFWLEVSLPSSTERCSAAPTSSWLSLSLSERARGQMSVPTAAAAKYGPSWLKPKVNKIGSKCINFTDKPFTTSVVG